jgi:hypothetical protein
MIIGNTYGNVRESVETMSILFTEFLRPSIREIEAARAAHLLFADIPFHLNQPPT